jgi:integrase
MIKKGLKPASINLAYRTLGGMLGEAVKQKVLTTNPAREVKKLKVEETERTILSLEEIRKLFPADYTTVWDSWLGYKANKLAACTGMRIGELRGLRGEYVYDDYIYVAGQYTRQGYVGRRKRNRNGTCPSTRPYGRNWKNS